MEMTIITNDRPSGVIIEDWSFTTVWKEYHFVCARCKALLVLLAFHNWYKSYSYVATHYLIAPDTRISNEKVNTIRVNGVNTARQTIVSTVKGTGVTAIKASAGCVWRPKMTDLNNVSKDNSRSWVSKRVNYIDPQGRLKEIYNKLRRTKEYLIVDVPGTWKMGTNELPYLLSRPLMVVLLLMVFQCCGVCTSAILVENWNGLHLVLDLEKEKDVQAVEILKLKKRVKRFFPEALRIWNFWFI
ncbi:hypothetical protein Tco_0690709, partial [Tanacetum coccineum]